MPYVCGVRYKCDAIPRIGIGAFTGLLHLTFLWHTCHLSYHSIPLYQHKRKKGLYIRKHLTRHWRSGPGVRASTRTQAISVCRARARCTTTDRPLYSWCGSRPSGRPHLALAASATQVVPGDSDTSLAQAQGPRCWLRLESLVKVPRHGCRPSENGLGHDTCWSHLLVNRSRKVIGKHGLNRPDPGPSYTERNRKQIS